MTLKHWDSQPSAPQDRRGGATIALEVDKTEALPEVASGFERLRPKFAVSACGVGLRCRLGLAPSRGWIMWDTASARLPASRRLARSRADGEISDRT
jgi:hypothetical protein